MQNSHFDYSSTHIEPPAELGNDIAAWGRKHVSDDDIYVSLQEDFSYGREDEIHVTVLYGIHSEHPDELRTLLAGEKPVHVQLGEVRVFSNAFKFDVLVVEVFSQDLTRLNKKLTEHMAYTNRYETYNPHLTIAYVKKGRGWKFSGYTRWKGRKFVCDYVVFSSKNGTKKRIVLQ